MHSKTQTICRAKMNHNNCIVIFSYCIWYEWINISNHGGVFSESRHSSCSSYDLVVNFDLSWWYFHCHPFWTESKGGYKTVCLYPSFRPSIHPCLHVVDAVTPQPLDRFAPFRVILYCIAPKMGDAMVFGLLCFSGKPILVKAVTPHLLELE